MKTGTIRTMVLAAAALLVLPTTGWAQEPGVTRPEEGADEGITVHGHWTIEVVRDGEVIERRAFENALVNQGVLFLVGTLGRESTTGFWTVLLLADGTGEVCSGDAVAGASCRIREFDSELTVSTPDSGDDAGTLILAGSDTAVRDGNIVEVHTMVQPCDPSVAPSDCSTSGTANQFTRRVLGNSIAFQNGDQINVTVVISFS